MPFKYINKNLIIKCSIEAVFIDARIDCLTNDYCCMGNSDSTIMMLLSIPPSFSWFLANAFP
jgi:hypothetical protein